jgi:hypothetical protein
MAKDLFEVVLSGAVKIEINQIYPLKVGFFYIFVTAGAPSGR